jgi:hypothetical protein
VKVLVYLSFNGCFQTCDWVLCQKGPTQATPQLVEMVCVSDRQFILA